MKKMLTLLVASAIPWLAGAVEPARPGVFLEDFKLVGELTNGQAAFVLTAIARVEAPKGAELELLSGSAALTDWTPPAKWRLRAEPSGFVAVFDRAGRYPIQLKFHAAVRRAGSWCSVNFQVAPGTLQSIRLRGLPADTQFEFPNAARPERSGDEFTSFLPETGAVQLAWRETKAVVEGKLFYSSEMLSQISVSPGLMRQTSLLDFKVMQGELTRLTFTLHGPGEVTRVQGENVLGWNLEPNSNPAERRLVVQLNQPQKEQFRLQFQFETPLGAFPQTAEVLQLRPDGATRFAGYLRVVNEGAVRLEVAHISGLSQISPEQFPENDNTRNSFPPGGQQKFAYRFSGADFGLQIQADQILPELGVSELLSYRLAENELDIDGEIELEIREAPLRELLLRIPRGYAIARLTVPGLSDYSTRDLERQDAAELRLVFGQPISGRQLIQLRLERNQSGGETNWVLPRLEVDRAKSIRGHVAVAAEPGFRLIADRLQGLTEIATAFFPGKLPGIQNAFRIGESSWQATLRVERLPQAVQADGFHLFSIGEGIAYGSSVINYAISGAPVASFKIELSEEYFNVEFTGKDIRNWQKTPQGYVVQLHTPVAGPYTLLATYERPFKAQGETLAFTGARPLDAQTEQGHTLVISAYQFQVKPVEVSSGLLALETGEVPPEYRLFFDAPILAAYRYSARPFHLNLALSPLAQGDSLSQVVDRASLTTRISKEGQVLTELRYFVKNRGNPHLRLVLPPDTQLWTALVNGAPVVPVKDAQANLIPLPLNSDPNAVLTLDLKLAGRSRDPHRITVATPSLNAPVMLCEWKVEPDAGQRLEFLHGSLLPMGGSADTSGFLQLKRTLTGADAVYAICLLTLVFVLTALALQNWRRVAANATSGDASSFYAKTALGLIAAAGAIVVLLLFAQVVHHQRLATVGGLAFLAPVQQPNTALNIQIVNAASGFSTRSLVQGLWPVLLAIAIWICNRIVMPPITRPMGLLVGWMLLTWAALRASNGGVPFLAVLLLFLVIHVFLPALRQLGEAVRSRRNQAPQTSSAGAATATVACLLISFGWLTESSAIAKSPLPLQPAVNAQAVADSISQQIRIEDQYVLASAKLHWRAERGQRLPILLEPAVLTRLDFASNSLRLERVASLPSHGSTNMLSGHELIALRPGEFDIDLRYELRLANPGAEATLTLPVPPGLVNRLQVTVANLDVEVFSPVAVSIQRDHPGSNTVATLVLPPVLRPAISWKPRTRDVQREKSVFYAEWTHLLAPAAGVIELTHRVSIRPAQGELTELLFTVPAGATVVDVADGVVPTGTNDARRGAELSRMPLVALWRFDPDSRKLRVSLRSAQSRPFDLRLRTQIAAGPLPFEKTIGLLAVDGAASQLGLLGVATGSEVQLDSVTATSLAPINLEDFPRELTAPMQGIVAGLNVRRAFRYGDEHGTLSIKASAAEPDVRVEAQNTVSLGDDRTVLAANLSVNITRAGIFKLSFALPTGFDVESISGAALSHWTESKADASRIITLHLNGKTEGQQTFAISLAGPGVKATNGWLVPQLDLREAAKQQGSLLLVPEQGLRLQLAASEGFTQLDPQKSGIKQKGVLAFRMLPTAHRLTLVLERVDPWIQVTSLQHATVTEAQIKIVANLHYQIENAGLKSFTVLVPTNAEAVHFQGDQLADFLPAGQEPANGLRTWEIKLHRRVVGSYHLQLTFQLPLPEKSSEAALPGVQAVGVNLQRGFVTVQSSGRLQVRSETPPPALQTTEWQSIPRALQEGITSAGANFSYRLVEPSFVLALKLERHEAAKLLEAHVNRVAMSSVISDEGVMLTLARLEILPGDKRLLNFTLPPSARFWFAFVNQNGVWPWRDGDRILIPLEQSSRGAEVIPVEIFYSCQVGKVAVQSLDLGLIAPKFDLPLENITWRVSLGDKWRLQKWTGSLQLQQEEWLPPTAAADPQNYLQGEATQRQERIKAAERYLAAGNSALQLGDPQQARRSFQAAFGMSAQDAAFNEDARVQLHNIKIQQALIGLNVKQADVLDDPTRQSNKLRELRSRKELNYTQQDAKDILARNAADDNSALMRLAERLIQQQDAAVATPTALRANLPEQGHLLIFQRSISVDPWADLQLHLRATATTQTSFLGRTITLAMIALLLGVSIVYRPRSVLERAVS